MLGASDLLRGVGPGFLLLGGILAWAMVHSLGNLFALGTRHIPGPFAAKFTNLYRLYDVFKGHNHASLVSLHRQYGDNVRIGPRVVSIRNLRDVNKVYAIKGGYVKVCGVSYFKYPVTPLNKLLTRAVTRATSTPFSNSLQTASPPRPYSPH